MTDVADELEQRISTMLEQGVAASREDAIDRIRSAATVDVPRLAVELEAYRAQAAKSAENAAEAIASWETKADSHLSTIDEGEAVLALESAILDAVGGPVGADVAPMAGGVGAANDLTIGGN